MVDAHEFRQLVSGKRRGVRAALLRGVLGAAEPVYRLAVACRNRRYDTGAAAIHRVGVPVVSVGNLTVGGTGKTPMVEWLAKWFRGHRKRVALVSRGYGAEAGARNDEALELEDKLPDVPHLQNPDRVAAARTAIEELESEVIILDDAFQHRRIHRDLDLVLVDALEPFGYGRVLPRGLLREPPAGLGRADFVVLSRADAVSSERRQEIRRQVSKWAPSVEWAEVTHQPIGWRSHSGRMLDVNGFRGQPVAAFCGVGNPAGFRHSLATLPLEIVGFRQFPDHHAYSRDDLASLENWAQEQQAAAVVCTHKDLVKVGIDELGSLPLWALQIGIEFMAGSEALERRLRTLVSD